MRRSSECRVTLTVNHPWKLRTYFIFEIRLKRSIYYFSNTLQGNYVRRIRIAKKSYLALIAPRCVLMQRNERYLLRKQPADRYTSHRDGRERKILHRRYDTINVTTPGRKIIPRYRPIPPATTTYFLKKNDSPRLWTQRILVERWTDGRGRGRWRNDQRRCWLCKDKGNVRGEGKDKGGPSLPRGMEREREGGSDVSAQVRK